MRLIPKHNLHTVCCGLRLEKDEEFRTCITVGDDRVNYEKECGMSTADKVSENIIEQHNIKGRCMFHDM